MALSIAPRRFSRRIPGLPRATFTPRPSSAIPKSFDASSPLIQRAPPREASRTAATHSSISRCRRYLRRDATRSEAFVAAARALLDAGADPNAGFWTTGSYPEFETALYGAAGVAHHPELTQLLLERGADPNDEEAVYHSPETDDNRAMALLVESGRLTNENLVMMLVRQARLARLRGRQVSARARRRPEWHAHAGLASAAPRDCA